MNHSRMLTRTLTILLVFVFALQNDCVACSAFGICKKDRVIVGKNLDWFCSLGFLVVNKRNVTKRAFLPATSTSLQWTSKHGSITFTQNGVGFASGGMNEAGLVIEESWLGQTEYPAPDRRPVIDEIQWIQYQLDNCATVEEVLKTDSTLRIQKYFGESHYFVYDRSGKAAAIDFLHGAMVYHVLGKTDVQVLANDTYQASSDSLKSFMGFGGDRTIPRGSKSIYRFSRAARMIREFETNDSTDIVDYGFRVLSDVSQGSTVWSVVYDISNLRVYYKTSACPEIKEVPFSKFDFDPSSPMLLIDLNTMKKGDVSGLFRQYTVETNRDMVTRVIKNWHDHNFASNIRDEDLERILLYPETMSYGVTDKVR